MSDLEEMGYLEQPHTSAGRIPSSKGYRLYVDSMMDKPILSKEEDLKIKEYVLNSAMLEVNKIVKNASTLLSELTHLTCIVKTPSMSMSTLKSIQIVRMDDQNLLAVIVTDGGLIKNQIIRVNESPSVEVLSGINKILNQRLVHLSIEEINLEVINNLKLDLHGYDEVFNAMLPALYQCLKEDDTSRVFMEGTTNIFNYPEYNDIEKAKQILSLLHNKDCVVELIEPESDITKKDDER